MCVSHTRSRLAIAAVFGLLGLGAGWAPLVRAQAGPPARPPVATLQSARHFSATLTVRHRRLTTAGAPMGVPVPDTVMRVVREHRAGQWRTSLVLDQMPDIYIDTPGGPSRLRNPFLVSRVEFDDDEEDPRLFDREGRRVRAMTLADLPMLGAAESLRRDTRRPLRRPGAQAGAAWLADVGRHQERREEFVRRFGPPTGRVRGLDRYVSDAPDGRHEVLVTPETALPVELNSSFSGDEVQTTVAYQLHGGVGHVRRLMRSEQRFAQAALGRAVTEVAVGDVVISDEVSR